MTTTPTTEQRVTDAVNRVREEWSGSARVAMILGSGLGGLADKVAAEAIFDYKSLPHFPHSTALAHKGRLVCGQLCGTPVVTMQGRCHLYEGYSVDDVSLPVRVMNALGATTLIVSNASGGVNPQHRVGDLMVMDDHVNLMWSSPCSEGCVDADRFARDDATPYDPALIEIAQTTAREYNFVLHQGVYIAVTGPTYETRAEYRMFRSWGDTVGMSTVPEAIAARQCGMNVLGLSVLTNVAKPDAPDIIDAEDVVVVAGQAEANLTKIVEAVVSQQ